MFLIGCGILYGVAGTLNMADLAVTLPGAQKPELIPVAAVLFVVAFGIKAGAFPLFFWLPASYHTLPSPVAALFAGLLTKVGVYSMVRVFTLVFIQDTALTHGLIAVMAVFTMAVGVLGAAAQYDFRRLLSFHIISQIGYMILALGLYTPAALAGGIFYILHHIVVKSNLFLIAGITRRYQGSYDLRRLGGFYADRWWLAVLFIVPAFSLAGLPPLSGFWAKFAVVRAALEARAFVAAGVAIAVGLLTLFSMTKVWSEVFWKPQPAAAAAGGSGGKPKQDGPGIAWMVVPVALLAAVTLGIGFFPEPLYRYSLRAAGQLMDRAEYIRAVLEAAP